MNQLDFERNSVEEDWAVFDGGHFEDQVEEEEDISQNSFATDSSPVDVQGFPTHHCYRRSPPNTGTKSRTFIGKDVRVEEPRLVPLTPVHRHRRSISLLNQHTPRRVPREMRSLEGVLSPMGSSTRRLPQEARSLGSIGLPSPHRRVPREMRSLEGATASVGESRRSSILRRTRSEVSQRFENNNSNSGREATLQRSSTGGVVERRGSRDGTLQRSSTGSGAAERRGSGSLRQPLRRHSSPTKVRRPRRQSVDNNNVARVNRVKELGFAYKAASVLGKMTAPQTEHLKKEVLLKDDYKF